MLKNISRSLQDLLGEDYIAAVCEAGAFLSGLSVAELKVIVEEKVDFYPLEFQQRQDELLQYVGKKICSGLGVSVSGAPTASFAQAQHNEMAPVGGAGVIRIGEDGRAYFIGKSEHYHASLGHSFPGYQLLANAAKIGISNVTHNNTRGYISRLLEQELIRVANGLRQDDRDGLEKVLKSSEPHVLNRVINLETGSLAVEAALKMMLARFYRLDRTYSEPQYAGIIPVFLVMADNNGGKEANYHGTTVLTQVLRGMWPDFADTLEKTDIFRVEPVRINDAEHFAEVVGRYDSGEYKIAGFFHELVLMNYGGIRLTEDFVRKTHAICSKRDIPVIVDEIQSCMWSPELFLFKEYDCHPDFVSVGKGFPGGQYPASKILTTAAMDSLNQFGALVTNGQEELASLAYLITIEFAEANQEHTRTTGKYYHNAAAELVAKYSSLLDKVEGEAHMTTLYFKSAECVIKFTNRLNNECCIDISAQTYKADCPPSALTKLPLIASRKSVDFVIGKMDETLAMLVDVYSARCPVKSGIFRSRNHKPDKILQLQVETK